MSTGEGDKPEATDNDLSPSALPSEADVAFIPANEANLKPRHMTAALVKMEHETK